MPTKTLQARQEKQEKRQRRQAQQRRPKQSPQTQKRLCPLSDWSRQKEHFLGHNYAI